jgi:hypothetical protein
MAATRAGKPRLRPRRRKPTTNGLLRSGSTLKALTKYGQDLGTGDFQTYLGNLQGQQGVGLSGANALAGVGQSYAGAVGANNDSAASATGNAALVGAANTNALMAQLAGAAGAYGSSYGGSGSGSAAGSGYSWGNGSGAAAAAEAERLRRANPFGGY